MSGYDSYHPNLHASERSAFSPSPSILSIDKGKRLPEGNSANLLWTLYVRVVSVILHKYLSISMQ